MEVEPQSLLLSLGSGKSQSGFHPTITEYPFLLSLPKSDNSADCVKPKIYGNRTMNSTEANEINSNVTHW